ncbi:MAG TPA: PAS domain S-box protein [Desulfobacter sp.]|nr:PAS domain S-box protein [Desulfobacter sp.]
MKVHKLNLLDFEKVNTLLEGFNKSTGFVTAILDFDGNVLSKSGWRQICTEFHRINPETAKNCTISDTELAGKMAEGETYHFYKCLNGLIDVSVPLVINGEHIANLFSGQFFFEEPDISFFKKQAEKYGFDEDKYLAALKNVPVVSREKVKTTMDFLLNMTQLISETTFQKFEQMELNKAIEESEVKFRSYVDNAPHGIFITDENGKYIDVNPAACKITGYSKKELLNLSIPDLLQPDFIETGMKNFQELTRKGSVNNDLGFVAKSGENRFWNVSAVKLSNQRFLRFAKDITERKQAIEDLRKSEAKHSKMLANIGDVIVIIDQNGINRYKSPNIEQLFGWKPEEVVGASAWDNVHPDDIEPTWKFFEKIMHKPDVIGTIECRYRCKDGSYKWIEFTGTNLFHDPDILGLLGNYQDITERKQAELALLESETRFKALHNASFGGIIIHDQGVILECNQGLSEMTGYEYAELIGMNGLMLISEKSRKKVTDNIRAGYEKPYEAFGLRKNGEEFPMRLEARNVPYKGKQVRTVEFRDLTEQKQAEAEKEKLQAQLSQAQKMESVGRLAGGVAHDFNNMLNIILGNTEMAIEDIAPDDPVHGNLGEILSAAKRSADITRQLLAFSRKQTIAPKILNLNDTIESMLRMLRRLIGEDIDLAWLPGANIRQVRMDPSQIDQILANLCVNARDAIADVGKITIETGNTTFDSACFATHSGFVAGDFVLLAVSDDGCGMDQETISKMFDPFFSTKDVGKGTGLGLATVYGIVKQNDGFINVYSEPDQGTTFRIYLPQYRGEADNPEKKTADKIDMDGNETILLVEDEPSILRMTRIMLERMGYTILAAGTPGEAIALAREHAGEIHMLMTDVVMPEMNGRDLAKNLLSLYPDLKRLFMSGYTANVIAHHGVLDEGVQFIHKPFSKQDLAIKVRKVLDEATG